MSDGIGARARMVRRRRGLSLDEAAGLAGISKSYLSRLENGQRSFERRGLIEDLAEALSCSPSDLTGAPNISPDRRALIAASAIPALTVALHDSTLDDVPDVPVRPIADLEQLARAALVASDQVQFEGVAGDRLGSVITELHVLAATSIGQDRMRALVALVDACIVARALAGTLGHGELAVTATRRGWDAARLAERPDLAGFMAMGRGLTLGRIGARRRATRVLADELARATAMPGPSTSDSSTAQAVGMMHLAAAHLAGKDGATGDADTHLQEAAAIARFTGQQNHMLFHFGPANVDAWSLSIAVETERGPQEAERIDRGGIDFGVLGSAERTASVHFDLARAYAQADGARDDKALQHLDLADRSAPLRVRHDPIAQELVLALHRRARRKAWELQSLRARVGLG